MGAVTGGAAGDTDCDTDVAGSAVTGSVGAMGATVGAITASTDLLIAGGVTITLGAGDEAGFTSTGGGKATCGWGVGFGASLAITTEFAVGTSTG